MMLDTFTGWRIIWRCASDLPLVDYRRVFAVKSQARSRLAWNKVLRKDVCEWGMMTDKEVHDIVEVAQCVIAEPWRFAAGDDILAKGILDLAADLAELKKG
jgi:hypothetical protein